MYYNLATNIPPHSSVPNSINVIYIILMLSIYICYAYFPHACIYEIDFYSLFLHIATGETSGNQSQQAAGNPSQQGANIMSQYMELLNQMGMDHGCMSPSG